MHFTHEEHSTVSPVKAKKLSYPPPPPSPPLSIQYSVYCPTSCTLDRFTIRHSLTRLDSLFGMSPFLNIEQSSVSVQCERPRPGNHHLVAVQVSMVSHTGRRVSSQHPPPTPGVAPPLPQHYKWDRAVPLVSVDKCVLSSAKLWRKEECLIISLCSAMVFQQTIDNLILSGKL